MPGRSVARQVIVVQICNCLNELTGWNSPGKCLGANPFQVQDEVKLP